MLRLSTDVGGTFTDGILLDEDTGKIKISKVASTPEDPAIGTVDCIEKLNVSLERVKFLVHGTTVVINALLEKTGGKTALITTKGFRDLLEIRRSNREDIYDVLYKKPEPLVPRHLRYGVDERVDENGNILKPLNSGQLTDIIKSLKSKGVKSVGVCLLNAYVNPEHEKEIGKILQEDFLTDNISLSHNITRRYYEYERTSTTVQNAYVMPVVKKYLGNLENKLREKNYGEALQIMQSNGGTMTSNVARDKPISMVESGPVAGAIGAAQLANEIGYKKVISYDMGGTTAKSSISQGGLPDTSDQYSVDRRPILLPVVDIREIGAGGGSIAWVDKTGAIHVGPRSAGAEPGPACYKLGGEEPTVTDANLHLGLLQSDFFLGGEMDVSKKLATNSIKKLAQQLNLSVNKAASGIREIVNTKMAGLLRSITIKRGYDPREFVMVSFGGAGPTHATSLASELDIPTVIVPRDPGVFSARGMLTSNLRHDFTRTYICGLNDVDTSTVNQIFSELHTKIEKIFQEENIETNRIDIINEIDLRYSGQEHTLSIKAPSKIKESTKHNLGKKFDKKHKNTYGHNAPNDAKEVVSVRSTGIGKVKKIELPTIEKGETNPPQKAKIETSQVYSDKEEKIPFEIYERDKLLAGNEIDGPAIVVEATSTTVIEENQVCVVDEYGNLIITLTTKEDK